MWRTMMQELLDGILAEPASVWEIGYFDLTVRLMLSLLLGGIIGLEREWNNHAAGFRTHILVSLGSTAIMLLSVYGFSEFVQEENVRIDPARLAAQVISGIGFLGAGAILRNGLTVSGLTTAASIWVVAAIGLSTGAGFYYSSVLCTILVFLSLLVLNKWEKRWKKRRSEQELVIRVREREGSLAAIMTKLEASGIRLKKMGMIRHEDSRYGSAAIIEYTMKLESAGGQVVTAIEGLSAMKDILSADMKQSLEESRLQVNAVNQLSIKG
jgi:putative Mg2+ transporter-C (MgtC) family protein